MITLHLEAFIVVIAVTLIAGIILGIKNEKNNNAKK